MKWENMRRTNQVEDRRGQASPQGGRRSGMPSMNGMGGGMGYLLMQLLMNSGKGRWLILAIIGFSLLSNFMGGGGYGSNSYHQSDGYRTEQRQPHATSSKSQDRDADFMNAVLASTEDLWTEEFAKRGSTYRKPKMVLYSDSVNTSGCGFSTSATGPFYCPADETVYIDLSFYRELKSKYRAPGDFAMAYVVAHEVGHHVQKLTGTMQQVQSQRSRLSEKAMNQLNVKLELQADYYAGVWAKYVEGQGVLDVGDIEEALQAAHAVGDDTLQEQAYGHVVPDSFTHGSSQQRREWFMRGYQYADLEHGDTFNQIR